MKILITGGSGLLGLKLRDILQNKNYEVFSTFNNDIINNEDFYRMDVSIRADVKTVFEHVKPDFVVHTAAFTDVDGCELDQQKARSVNVGGTEKIAMYAHSYGAKLLYVSTDYVFDGKKGNYKETDETNPINFYGLSKLEGEKIIQNICDDYIIARTSVIFGKGRHNFFTWIIEKLQNNEQINIVTDQFVSPTFNLDLSEQILALIQKNESGIFHTAGGQSISRYNFATIIADIFSLDKTLINPIKMQNIDWVAKRPMDSSLDVSKILKIKKPFMVKKAVKLLAED